MMTDILQWIPDSLRSQLIKRDQPEWIEPMLATLTHDVFSDPGWIFERKLDGERCLIFKNGLDVRLMSRNRKMICSRYPEIAVAFAQMDIPDLVVDGEIVTFSGHVTSFSKLQERMHVSNTEKAKKSSIAVYYYVFDLMYVDPFDLTSLPLRERKKILKKLLVYDDPIRFTLHRNEQGLEYYRDVCQKGWEGLIAKNANSEYQHRRSTEWLKFKCSKRQEFVIIGYTDPGGKRIGFGALLLGYYHNDQLQYAGKVGTGFDDDRLQNLSKRLKEIEIEHSPLAEKIPENSVHWVQPVLVGEVSFTEWTEDHKLRHPSFQGLRDDKDPNDVVNEQWGAKRMDTYENP